MIGANKMNPITQLVKSFANGHMLLCGLFMLLGIVVLARLGTPVRPSAIGRPLPELDLKPLLNTDGSIEREDLMGKIVVIHFWGTWCGPCRMEFPEFTKVFEEFGSDSQVRMLSVSCSSGPEYDEQKLAEGTEEYLAQLAPNMATYCDPVAMTRVQIGNMMPSGSLGYPTTVLFDQNGLLVEFWEGYSLNGMKELSAKIKALL